MVMAADIAEATGQKLDHIEQRLRGLAAKPTTAFQGHVVNTLGADGRLTFMVDRAGISMLAAVMDAPELLAPVAEAFPQEPGHPTLAEIMSYAAAAGRDNEKLRQNLWVLATERDAFKGLAERLGRVLEPVSEAREHHADIALEPQCHTPIHGKRLWDAAELTDMGLLGKDDVYRWYPECWKDGAWLAKRDDFFGFVRRELEIKRSTHRHPRLKADAIRMGLAGVFAIRGPRHIPDTPVKNLLPPSPSFSEGFRRFPQIRLTPDGVRHLAAAWFLAKGKP